MKKNISVFDQYFEPQIMERGIGYYYNDLVKYITNHNNHQYTAKIDGTRVYDVMIKFNDSDDGIVEAKCNCPYSVDREKYCKHIYALLYALKGEKLDNKPIRKPTRYTPPTGEIVNIKCPNCGSNLRIESPSENIECKYCHSSFALDIRLAGLAKKLNEILEQAELYYSAEDYKEAYYEFAKAHNLDKDNKFIEYCMDVSGRLKNLETNLSLNDYSGLYDDMKEVYNDPSTDDEKKRKLCVSFITLLIKHANKHLNRFDITGNFFWSELDSILDYFYKMFKDLDLSNELKIKVYKNYIDVLKVEIREYDTFSDYATNSKIALEKALHRMEQEKEECEKNTI